MDRPFLWGINHLKLGTANIRNTQAFYCNILGMEYLPRYDCYNGQRELISIMIRLKHTEEYATLIELRQNEGQAIAQSGMDPITYAVRGRDYLEKWKRWFEHNGVFCSAVYPFETLKGWAVAANDPDGRIVQLYCDEKHEMSPNFDAHDF